VGISTAEVRVPGDSPSVRRRRARLTRAVTLGVALSLPLASVSSQAASRRTATPAVEQPSTTDYLAWMTPTGIAAVLDMRDLADFERIAERPAATPPKRRLPTVHLQTISAGTIPPVVAAAYLRAARLAARSTPGCGVRWWLIAGIGFVESGHAASGGSGARHWDGVARPPILGPVLDGSGGFAAIRDSDDGAYDGNKTWDRAVGPMQFLPSTWERWGVRPNGELGNPQAIRPAAAATAGYLCASAGEVSSSAGMARAVFSYNHSFDYVRLVLSVAARYAGLNPSELGVDDLPTDKEFRQRHHKTAEKPTDRKRTDSSEINSDPGGEPAPATSSPSPDAAPSPSPSPSPSSGGGGVVPEPDPSSTPLPLPTGTLLLFP
jgi:membrane-bound lytic murein transglycosylase B